MMKSKKQLKKEGKIRAKDSFLGQRKGQAPHTGKDGKIINQGAFGLPRGGCK